jgi:hypothetical protein
MGGFLSSSLPWASAHTARSRRCYLTCLQFCEALQQPQNFQPERKKKSIYQPVSLQTPSYSMPASSEDLCRISSLLPFHATYEQVSDDYHGRCPTFSRGRTAKMVKTNALQTKIPGAVARSPAVRAAPVTIAVPTAYVISPTTYVHGQREFRLLHWYTDGT